MLAFLVQMSGRAGCNGISGTEERLLDILERSPLSHERRLRRAADIHSHILPGIDDGAVTLDDSVLMAAVSARYGTTLMAATPHRYHGGHENTPDTIRGLVQMVRTAVRATSFADRFDLRSGQEIPLTMQTGEELLSGRVMTLNDNGVYTLVEPAFGRLPEWTAAALKEVVRAGFKPVLAHPERNASVQHNPEMVRELVEAGALLQLTAMSVTGVNGPGAEYAAEWILENGLATTISSDCHSASWRPPNIRSAYNLILRRFGIELADRLCSENPRALILGEPIAIH